MAVSRVVEAGRRAAERLMTARCVVRRVVGHETVGFEEVPVYETIYEGICKPQSFRPQESSAGSQSGSSQTVTRSEVHFPVGRFVAQVGDVVTMTASTHNPLLVGKSFRVVDDDLVTEQPTAYHVPVTRNAAEPVAPFVPVVP